MPSFMDPARLLEVGGPMCLHRPYWNHTLLSWCLKCIGNILCGCIGHLSRINLAGPFWRRIGFPIGKIMAKFINIHLILAESIFSLQQKSLPVV